MNDLALKSPASVTGARVSGAARGHDTTIVDPSRPNQTEAQPAPRVVAPEQVKAAVEQIESYLKASRRELQFQVDDESGEIVVQVRDATTGEVIRQIPGEDALRIVRALQDKGAMFLDVVV